MPDYSQGKIYVILSEQNPTEVYIGSTTRSLSRRFIEHKNRSKRQSNDRMNRPYNSKKLFEQYDDVCIRLIKEFPCNSKKELEEEEKREMLNWNCLNLY